MAHLTFDERLLLQIELLKGTKISRIAELLSKDQSTVRREILGHRHPVNSSKAECDLLARPPYVCNGCRKNSKCSKHRYRYDAKQAHQEYVDKRSNSRRGIAISDAELQFLEDNVVPLIMSGVSVTAACNAFASQMPVSEKTVYSYIDGGILSVKNIDLHRKVRRKYRRKSGPSFKVDKQYHIGRSYDDFTIFIRENPGKLICEMDTVEGEKGGKVLLTILFRDSNLQLLYLRNRNTSASVTDIFCKLRERLKDDFHELFQIILTDRGTEFSDPRAIEVNVETGEIECNVFYCDPMRADQKGRCERNHELIRYVVDKGESFDQYFQEDIDKLMNHINSCPRPSLNGKSPIQVFRELHGDEMLKALGLEEVKINELCLKPELLKTKMK